jgi:transmembrane sensor
MSQDSDMDKIRGQAERWLVRLRADDCTAAERHRFEAWLTADSRHATAYEETQRMWSSMDELAHDPEIAQWRSEAGSMSAVVSPWYRRRWLAGAVGMLIMLFGGYAVWQLLGSVTTYHYAALRDIRHVTLADGSRVTLNVNTRLDVRLDRRARTVLLRNGEAMFDVVHEVGVPFSVLAGRVTMIDMGTQFDVARDGAQTIVAVLHGRVAVTQGERTTQLQPGDRLAISGGSWDERRVDTATIAGWMQGKLVFRATPLSEVVAQANRYGPDHLVIDDPSLDGLKVSGEFRIGNTGALVRALQSAFPIRADRDGASGEIRLRRL